MAFVSDIFFKDVAAYTESSQDTVIPSGETWEIQKFVGSAAYIEQTSVKLLWDFGGAGQELVASTHGDGQLGLAKQVTGDGVKKLSIVLCNESGSAQSLGGTWEGKEL